MEKVVLSANYPAISKSEQEIIDGSRVAVFGCGEAGGLAAELFVRMGVKHVTLVDKKTISEKDRSGCLYANAGNVGKKRVYELSDRIKSIDDKVEVRCWDTRAIMGYFENIVRSNDLIYFADEDDALEDAVISACEKESVKYVTEDTAEMPLYQVMIKVSGSVNEAVEKLIG
ncbi:MAG: ThiF family adenylyltransferase [Lachnospiraceae bacterium]|jgi:tRNA A37 threonylcarbamoyladenosine dehydratase